MKTYLGKFLLALLTITLVSSFVPVDGYKVGDQAADFKLKNVDGSMVSLADYKGVKGYIVVFTCNTCPML
jgi:peroxiredoxin